MYTGKPKERRVGSPCDERVFLGNRDYGPRTKKPSRTITGLRLQGDRAAALLSRELGGSGRRLVATSTPEQGSHSRELNSMLGATTPHDNKNPFRDRSTLQQSSCMDRQGNTVKCFLSVPIPHGSVGCPRQGEESRIHAIKSPEQPNSVPVPTRPSDESIEVLMHAIPARVRQIHPDPALVHRILETFHKLLLFEHV